MVPSPHASSAFCRAPFWVAGLLLAAACAQKVLPVSRPPEASLWVTASAYTSHPGETDDTPQLAAWGDRLGPGTRAIAVSPDLLERGLVRGTRVRIEGLPGEYVVLDRMADRWRNHIDIYMGYDRPSARAWGRKKVRIAWSDSP
jgi:3D (Asp-Asp-Asp) domain-containing protein